MSKRSLYAGAALAALLLAGYRSGFAQAMVGLVLQYIAVQGSPVAASPAQISDHELQELELMKPQQQAERLLERAINHYDGAAGLIDKKVDSWRGSVKVEGQLNTLITSALNSNDLRVRAAAIEVDIAAYGVEKTPESALARIRMLEAGEGDAVSNLWLLGLLGNRGVEPERIFQVLAKYVHDPEARVRHWAVEGLSYLGTDAAIEPLLDVFRNDPSPEIRERAACGLAQSGMLQQAQRMKAVPTLLNYLGDATLDSTTHQWVLQALQDITGQRFGEDPTAWRKWYSSR